MDDEKDTLINNEGADDIIVTDSVRDVADQIRSGRFGRESPVEPETNPVSASAPQPTWRQREQERAERREELRLAQAVERRRIEEIAAAERGRAAEGAGAAA